MYCYCKNIVLFTDLVPYNLGKITLIQLDFLVDLIEISLFTIMSYMNKEHFPLVTKCSVQ